MLRHSVIVRADRVAIRKETGKVTISLRITPTTASLTTQSSGDIANLTVSPTSGVSIAKRPVAGCP